MNLVIGTRGSALALWQAEHVRERLLELPGSPVESVELKIIKTRGDAILDVTLSKVGGKGLFVKELEVALLEGDVDLAVHSLKDMPAIQPEGLELTVEQIQDCVERVLMEAGYYPTARAYIVYRERHGRLRRERRSLVDVAASMNEYLRREDWRVQANANQGYSLGGLILNVSGKVVANYWLDEVYSPEIGAAHREADLHIHDLDMLAGYCAGWSLRSLLHEGFNGVPGRIEAGPPKHLSSALGQMVNFLGTLQNEWAGAQAFSSFDTYLAPYVRKDSLTGRWYDCSAHLLWVGERTRQPDHAHFEFVRGIQNPLGVKISDKASPQDVLDILDAFNPDNIPGRVTLITRMGAEKLRTHLPPIIRAVQASGKHALWVSDPVHGNGYTSENGFKTRDFDAIRALLADPRLQDPLPGRATARWPQTGPLRVSYLLPSADLTVVGAGVHPASRDDLTGPHRLVWVDLALD